jgi:anti-sigma B factor antagonist
MRPLPIVEKDGVLVVTLGETAALIEGHAANVRQSVYSALEGRPEPQVVIDLSAIDYITSTGIALLIGTKRRVEARSGRLIIAGLQPEIAHLFAVMKLAQLFEIADNEAQALELLSSPPTH